jgi:hypothetical protein
MNAPLRNLLAVLVPVLVVACASGPSAPETMRGAQADFSAYKTFGWAHAPMAAGSGESASVVDGYIRTAIANDLKAKGYVEAAPAAGVTPDLVIEYEGAKSEKLKNNPFRIGVGVGSYGSSGGGSVGVGSSGVKEVKEGSLVVHVIDPARKSEVWRGSIARELGEKGVQPELVQAAVTELFRDFPARNAAP